MNIYENNYNKYIDIGVKKDLFSFLLENNSSVYATIWGHGGVGKTAAIQSCIEDLSNQSSKEFDYIIFLSAKDRYYDYYRGTIVEIAESINSLQSIIQKINSIIFSDESNKTDRILSFEGKALFVIDDFETFSELEQKNIIDFITKLNINHHKVILTTRSANLINGNEIKTQEFSIKQSIDFLIEIIKIQFPHFNRELLTTELNQIDLQEKIFSITSGRPLFIFQLAIIIGQKFNVSEALDFDIKRTESAIDFLYGRIYDYLSNNAKDLFVAMSLITTDNDLSNLLNKLKFIVNMEKEDDVFLHSINELEKLKIIEVIENEFFRIYSAEIFQKMKEYLFLRDEIFKTSLQERLQKVSEYKDLDTEIALLKNADASRISKDAKVVEENYREIIIRPSANQDIKLTALLHFTHYLFNDINEKKRARKLFEEFEPLFKTDGIFINRYAHYYWSEGHSEQKNKAINLILNYFKITNKQKSEIDLEILGQLVHYRSMLVISDREELKNKKHFGDIKERDFAKQYKEQTITMNSIFKHHGMKLFNCLVQKNKDELSPKIRQQLFIGLFQFTEVCIRLKKYKAATDICDFIIDNYPSSYSNQFLSKITKIKKYTMIDMHRGILR